MASLADYISLVGTLLSDKQPYWFRGHADATWPLIPTALRPSRLDRRNAALGLLRDFRRVAEIKLSRPPGPTDHLPWLQLAQHYGIPTRLLDWTESATIGLYFACADDSGQGKDGIVYLFNPMHCVRLKNNRKQTSLDAQVNQRLISAYFDLDGSQNRRSGLPTVAIRPVWNSDRLMLQRGVFTLHGSSQFALDDGQVPSLVGLPILRKYKDNLRLELERIGVDEMTVFPELEHACRHLKRTVGRED